MNNKPMLGISMSEMFGGELTTYRENNIPCLEFRAVKGNDRELIAKLASEAMAEKAISGILTPTVHLPHCDGFDLSSVDETQRKKAIENHTEILKLLLPLEPKIAVIHPSCGDVEDSEAEARINALIKSFKELCPVFKNMGVKVAVENLTQVSMVQTGEVINRIIDEVGDNIGACFDVNHLFGQTHKDFIRSVGKRIITMHMSDNDGIAEKHLFPGDGVIDFKEIIEEMQRLDYTGTMVFECTVHKTFPQSAIRLGKCLPL